MQMAFKEMATRGHYCELCFYQLVTWLLEDCLWVPCHFYTSTVCLKIRQAFQMLQNKLLSWNVYVHVMTWEGYLQESQHLFSGHNMSKYQDFKGDSKNKKNSFKNPADHLLQLHNVLNVQRWINQHPIPSKSRCITYGLRKNCLWIIIISRLNSHYIFFILLFFFLGKNNTGESDSATGS